VWLLIAGLLFRIGFCLMTSKTSALAEVDGREHLAYAQSLLALRWDNYPRYFNCIRPPLYPIFLIPFIAVNDQVVWHIQLAQSVIGVLLAIVLAVIAGRWAGQRAGNWAFVIALFHPFLIFYCAFVLTEILFMALLWCGIACLQRLNDPSRKAYTKWLICSAVVLALGCLTRPALQPFLIVAVAWIGWRTWRMGSWSIALKRMIYFTAIVSAFLLPVMFANLHAHGDLSLSPNCAQRLYALGNSVEYLGLYEAKSKDEYYQKLNGINTLLSAESGKPANVWMEEVRLFRQEHPADWRRLQWYKFKHFWTPWLNPLIFPRMQFIVSVLSATPLFLLAGAELVRRRFRDPFLQLLVGLVVVGYLVSGFLFHVQVRYRLPFVDVSFIILTASFLGRFTFKKFSESRVIQLLRPTAAL
jgi:4-amino-4-deoxy-L-arabinose transferase-like glycosyltransferase